jgi:4-hydroxy-2-oxoheptanedioate aldolase
MTPPRTSHPVTIGSWIKLPVPVSVEAVFAAGADFACIDMCNGHLSIETVSNLLAHAATGPRLVRLAADARPPVVGQHVDSPEQAQQFVAAALFAPDGHRGMGSTGRQGRWGLDSVSDYLDRGRLGGGGPSIAIMIEGVDALEQLDELARLDGVTQVLVGSADLGLELGHDAQALERATTRVAAACAKHGVSAGIAVGRPADVGRLHAQGFDAFYLSNDATLLARAAQAAYLQARASSATSVQSR